MTRYITTRNAWGDGMKAETSIVPELILPFEEVKAKCREIGYEIVEYSSLPPSIDGIVFIDCPPIDDPLYRLCVNHGLKFLLLITENLYLQPNKTYAEVGKHAAKILSYEANPLFPEKTVRLRYPVDLKNGLALRQKALQGERPYLLGMIAGLKQSAMPGSLYAKRAEWAFQLSTVLDDKFALWGPGWKESGYGKSARGFLPPGLTAKHDALSKCEFALCLENNNSIPGYVTEKLFNALIAGCIPIYEGDKNEIPPEWRVYVDASKFYHPFGVVGLVEYMTRDAKNDIIAAGDRFLATAEKFSTETYANTLFEAIKSIL